MADGTPVTAPEIIRDLTARFGDNGFVLQTTADRVPTVWVALERLHEWLIAQSMDP